MLADVITEEQLESIYAKLGAVRCAGTSIGALVEELRALQAGESYISTGKEIDYHEQAGHQGGTDGNRESQP